jgi:uncharacterized membrane protein YjgN (DUF898 family)
MMDAARTSETSVDIELRTRQYIPEDSELQGVRFVYIASFFTMRLKSEFFVECFVYDTPMFQAPKPKVSVFHCNLLIAI